MIGIRAVIMTFPLTILLVLSASDSDCDAGPSVPATQNVGGEILYNGIQLPPVWPARRALKREPMPVPYLAPPPAVIAIDLGRQLFVDAIYRGLPKERAKPTEVLIGFSRDGFHWDRSNRTPFFPVSEHQGDWNWCNVQSCGGGCLIVGDQLYFYCSGRAGLPGTNHSGRSATGLATMRRDGFASMDTPGRNVPSEGELTTRPVRFSGKYLFVNADTSGGELRAQLLDENGKAVAPFTFDNCIPASGDHTKMAVKWKDAPDISRLGGKPVRFQFRLTNVSRAASLYAFWVSPDANGASHGYVGAGGPGFDAAMDTVVK